MAKPTILVADNDEEYLATAVDFLEKEGFKVLPAASVTEARRILDLGGIDLAVLDLRLARDKDPMDVSGLTLAKQSATHVPKIVLTRWPTLRDVREALGPQLEGLPTAVDFVAKQEGLEVLLQAIKGALKLVTRYRQISDSLNARIALDYGLAIQQARWSFWSSLIISVAGMLIVFLGAYLAIRGILAVAVPSAVAGLITEVIGALFFRRTDSANQRVDERYRELVKNQWMDKLMAACDEIPSEDAQNASKQRVIEAGAMVMLSPESASQTPKTRKPVKRANSSKALV